MFGKITLSSKITIDEVKSQMISFSMQSIDFANLEKKLKVKKIIIIKHFLKNESKSEEQNPRFLSTTGQMCLKKADMKTVD